MNDVLITIKDTLISTPWWVYVLFFLLLQRGISASKTQVVSLRKLAILPVALSIWSIIELLHFGGLTASLIGVFVLAFALGCLFGWLIVSKRAIKVVDTKDTLLKMPGSWATLTIIMVIFITKYMFGFLMAVAPRVMHHTGPLVSMFAVSAILSGMLCGRLINYVYRLRLAKHADETQVYINAE